MIFLSILLLLILMGLELWSWRMQREQRKGVRELEARIDHLELALRELASAQLDLHRQFLGDGSGAETRSLSASTKAQPLASVASSSSAMPAPRFAAPGDGVEEDPFPDDERYARARRLAMAGASARTIASQCRLGEEEAELLLRLHGAPAARQS